ncbi:hypothetical protein M885DRAFT_620269 [Pelagophyceae sp. CCMP2097]|nr:hypothetical protein M885DRAFT_620269 [Pelagophyceae sp. CCMP2097]
MASWFDSSVATPLGLSCMASKRLPPECIDLAAAQLTPVVRISQLLTAADVAAVHALGLEVKKSCGSVVRQTDDVSNTAIWRTTYLSTDSHFQKRLPALFDKIVAAALDVDARVFGLAAVAPLRCRVVEYHDVRAGGALAQADHYDSGSVLTIDVMLVDKGAFEGGDFLAQPVLNADGSPAARAFENAGDAVVFVSHKMHNVAAVTRGRRRVLIIELWRGDERTCAHRCQLADGHCPVGGRVSP